MMSKPRNIPICSDLFQDPPGEHVCGYSGRRFVHKRYYDKAEMGPSITYDQYLEEVKTAEKHYPQ